MESWRFTGKEGAQGYHRVTWFQSFNLAICLISHVAAILQSLWEIIRG